MLILEPQVFGDARGFFMESFNQKAFDAAVGRHVEFVQDNHSRSARGVLRGLHYQLPPHEQGKLVRVTRGSVFDVAIDQPPSDGPLPRPTYFGIVVRCTTHALHCLHGSVRAPPVARRRRASQSHCSATTVRLPADQWRSPACLAALRAARQAKNSGAMHRDHKTIG